MGTHLMGLSLGQIITYSLYNWEDLESKFFKDILRERFSLKIVQNSYKFNLLVIY